MRVRTARRAAATLLYQADLGRERLLNETGTFIWDRLDGRLGPPEIAAEMATVFDGVDAESAEPDVRAFAAELLAQGFAEPASGCAPPVTQVDLDDAPKQVDVSITGHCNAACTYCFYADEMEQRPDLPTERLAGLLRRAGLAGGAQRLPVGRRGVHPARTSGR